jgi:hypothetical protein
MLMIVEDGCSYCRTGKYEGRSEEVQTKKSDNVESRETKEEGPTGEGYLPFPAVQ